jgi:hypothetical protein
LQSPPVCDSHCRKFLSPPEALRQGARGRILNLVVDDVQSSKFTAAARVRFTLFLTIFDLVVDVVLSLAVAARLQFTLQ